MKALWRQNKRVKYCNHTVIAFYTSKRRHSQLEGRPQDQWHHLRSSLQSHSRTVPSACWWPSPFLRSQLWADSHQNQRTLLEDDIFIEFNLTRQKTWLRLNLRVCCVYSMIHSKGLAWTSTHVRTEEHHKQPAAGSYRWSRIWAGWRKRDSEGCLAEWPRVQQCSGSHLKWGTPLCWAHADGPRAPWTKINGKTSTLRRKCFLTFTCNESYSAALWSFLKFNYKNAIM